MQSNASRSGQFYAMSVTFLEGKRQVGQTRTRRPIVVWPVTLLFFFIIIYYYYYYYIIIYYYFLFYYFIIYCYNDLLLLYY